MDKHHMNLKLSAGECNKLALQMTLTLDICAFYTY